MHKLVKFLTPEKNILKLLEECAELQEVMLKYLNKSQGLKPKKEKIIEEMGDVMFRMAVVMAVLDIDENEVEKRAEYKWEVMDTWVDNKLKEQNVERNKVA